MKTLLAHPGTQYSFRLAAELHRHEKLAGFHTGMAFVSGGLFDGLCKLLPNKLRRSFANRRIEGVPASHLHLYLRNEYAAQARMRRTEGSEKVLHQRNECFQKAIPFNAIKSADAVIGFDTSSWILAQRCKQAGVPLILDQSIAHPDSKIEIFKSVLARFPEWSAGIEPRMPIVREAEQLEHDQSDLIVVASSFTMQTLVDNGVPSAKIRINPYGVDAGRFNLKETKQGHPFRFIFVGSVTARKGVPLLLEAWKKLKPINAELWLVGPIAPHLRKQIPESSGIRIFGGVPHSEIPSILRQCDVFVFPSYFEGFGLVIPEAMACGLPVITTTATAGPDIFKSGEAGWIISPGMIDQLVNAMDDCLTRPQQLPQLGQNARRLAEMQSWAAYGDRWNQILINLS
jgi:starch synthase